MLKLHPEIKIIHLNDGLMAAFFILLRVNGSGRKTVATLHGLDVVFPLSIYQKKILPLIVRQIDSFICVSKATKTECLKRNFPIEKLFVVHNGVTPPIDTEAKNIDFKISGINFEKDKIILAIGRPVKRKGFSWFAKEVMPLLSDEYKFIHVGNINTKVPFFYPFLSKRIQRLFDQFTGRADDAENLLNESLFPANRTFLVGKLSDRQRDFCISKASFLVMPNIQQAGDMEGFGLVALEGAIMGKIVLASEIEGITDAIQNNKNGYLLPSAEPASWVKKIVQLENTQPASIEFRDFTIQNYSWSKMVSGYSKVFQTLE